MKYYIPFISLFLINSVTSEICYAGGMKNHPISANTEQPPCWYKSADGTYSCFDIIHGSCPFPGNIKLADATLKTAAKKPETLKTVAKKPETLNTVAKKPETVKLTAKKSEVKKPIVCYRGNMKNVPVSGPSTPPCWYREPNGDYSCYEYKPGTSNCPNFPHRVHRPQ
jgi:hypothetical protein